MEDAHKRHLSRFVKIKDLTPEVSVPNPNRVSHLIQKFWLDHLDLLRYRDLRISSSKV